MISHVHALDHMLRATEGNPWRLLADVDGAVEDERRGFVDLAEVGASDATSRRFRVLRSEAAFEAPGTLRALYVAPVCERCRARGAENAALAVALVVDFQEVDRAVCGSCADGHERAKGLAEDARAGVGG